jgi:hypothetical protein
MGEGFEVAMVFLGMSSLIAVPLATLLGLPLAAWLGRAWIRLRERELELQTLQLAAQIRETHVGSLPHWVDANDPEQLLAWARADRELANLERH